MAANIVPVEILRQIFSYLVFADLVRVPLVSPSWYAVSVELLYRHPRIFPDSLINFLRTILTPSFEIQRTHVRTLSLTWRTFDIAPIDPVVLSIFRDAAEHHGLRLPTFLSRDSLVPLLLHLLPRIDTLHLFPPAGPTRHNAFLGTTPTSVHLPLALRSVRHISCTWFSHLRGVSSQMLLTMLGLPNIHSLEVHLLSDIDDRFPTATSVSSGVSRLHISYSEISLTSLASILLVPRALRQLLFSSIHSDTSDSPDALYDALAPLRPMLELLELHFRSANRWTVAPVLRLPQRETFQHWPVLWRLRCPMRLLLGDAAGTDTRHIWEVLPRGIRELAVCIDFRWNNTDVVEQLQSLLDRRMYVVPSLLRVAVNWNGLNRPVTWGSLQTLCQAADVGLVEEPEFSILDQNAMT